MNEDGADTRRKDQTVDRHLQRQGRLDAGTPGTLDRIGSLLGESSHFESCFEYARVREFKFVDADFCAQGEDPVEHDDDGQVFNLLKTIKLKGTDET